MAATDLLSERKNVPSVTDGPWFADPPADAASLRREILFGASKWDGQVGDIDAISTAPLIFSRKHWTGVARLAELLAAEIISAEDASYAAGAFGDIPRGLRQHLHSLPGPRIMRFDFHPTTEGWRVSEVNSDVPGGYVEAGPMARLVATRFPGMAPAGDPAASLAEGFARTVVPGGTIALMHATAFSDDFQAMRIAQHALEAQGFSTWMGAPDQFAWDRLGVPSVSMHGGMRRIDAILRFYPGEWLTSLSWRCQREWRSCTVPMANPLRALLSQSKRASLTWERLSVAMPTWRELVPESLCPSARLTDDRSWVVKPTWGREGADVSLHGDEPVVRTRSLRKAHRHPSQWVLQRRFTSLALESPWGPVHTSVGVFTVDGIAAGAFARAASAPRIDRRAVHVPVLIEGKP